jgi:hypothetical protein
LVHPNLRQIRRGVSDRNRRCCRGVHGLQGISARAPLSRARTLKHAPR